MRQSPPCWPLLGEHVGEQPEPEAVDQQGQQRRDAVVDPGAARVDQAGERAQQHVVGVVDGLADLAVRALAGGFLVARWARPGRSASSPSSRSSLSCCAFEPLSISSIANMANPSTTTTEHGDGDEADERSHRGLLSAAACRTLTPESILVAGQLARARAGDRRGDAHERPDGAVLRGRQARHPAADRLSRARRAGRGRGASAPARPRSAG